MKTVKEFFKKHDELTPLWWAIGGVVIALVLTLCI